MTEPLLAVEDLVTHYETRKGSVKAVNGVSLSVRPGEAVGIAGESGCGKSALGLSIMRLIPPPGRIVSGSVRLAGRDLLAMSEAEMRRVRGREMAMIFQDPAATLDPVQRIGHQVREMLELHTRLPRARARDRVVEMLEAVGISRAAERLGHYPHEFSGGMQQRVIIACALILEPSLLIADEPTTALDVTVQAQILELLREVQHGRSRTSIILVSHDLGVVSEVCERVFVMYAGKVIETGPTGVIIGRPRHPYTEGLMSSMPQFAAEGEELRPIRGSVPDLVDPPPGCAFHDRCPKAMDICRRDAPPFVSLDDTHALACHLYR